MTSRDRVFVVGSTNTDLVVHCTHLPRPGETVLGDELRTFSGGKGANQAVAAARAGARVHFIGAFGNDSFGALRRSDLEREGINCSGCRMKNSASGVALIAVASHRKTAHAENMIVVAPGANAELSCDDIQQALKKLLPSDVVLCSLEVPLDAVRCALKAGAKAGATTLLNPAPFPRAGLSQSLLRYCKVLIPNQAEFESMAGARLGSVRALKRSVDLLTQVQHEGSIIVTRGRHGAALYRNSRYTGNFVRAPRVKPLDTVGAGDCFSGAFAAALVRFAGDFEMAAKFATIAASIKVTRHGAQQGMPTLKEIETRLNACREKI